MMQAIRLPAALTVPAADVQYTNFAYMLICNYVVKNVVRLLDNDTEVQV